MPRFSRVTGCYGRRGGINAKLFAQKPRRYLTPVMVGAFRTMAARTAGIQAEVRAGPTHRELPARGGICHGRILPVAEALGARLWRAVVLGGREFDSLRLHHVGKPSGHRSSLP